MTPLVERQHWIFDKNKTKDPSTLPPASRCVAIMKTHKDDDKYNVRKLRNLRHGEYTGTRMLQVKIFVSKLRYMMMGEE
jgi:hypothetical protein